MTHAHIPPLRIQNSGISPTERPNLGVAELQRGCFSIQIGSGVPGFGFGWCRHGEPAVDHEGLTAPQVLAAFRDAWRTLNGSDWHWRITFDGFELVSDRDELIEGLDDLSSGTIADLTVHLRQAS